MNVYFMKGFACFIATNFPFQLFITMNKCVRIAFTIGKCSGVGLYFSSSKTFLLKEKVIFGPGGLRAKVKADFRVVFRHGQRLVAEPGPTPSPWSILNLFSKIKTVNVH